MKRKIRIAIPNKGRLKKPSIQALECAGIKLLKEERSYFSKTSDPKFEAIFARAFDVPVYVYYGAVDLGLTGHDLILERGVEVHELFNFEFGKCELVVASHKKSGINSVEDVSALTRVATEYPNLSKQYFQSIGKQVEILEVHGASEIAPKLGLAQIIVDVSSSGETLQKNNLKTITTILTSTARLACNKIAYRVFETEINVLLDKLRSRGLRYYAPSK